MMHLASAREMRHRDVQTYRWKGWMPADGMSAAAEIKDFGTSRRQL
jgi:hypothetical protein